MHARSRFRLQIDLSWIIGQLRDQFNRFCDEMNLDATLEPSRH